MTPIPVAAAVIKMAEAAVIIVVPSWYDHATPERGGEN
jgi:hypothetical protein